MGETLQEPSGVPPHPLAQNRQAPTMKHWICALTSHRCEYLGLDRVCHHPGAMASRLCVLCPRLQLHTCVHLLIYFRAMAPPILPLQAGLSKTHLAWHVGCILIVLWRKKKCPRYSRSSQSKNVIIVHLDMAQLSGDNNYNFIKLTYYWYVAYLL